MKCMNIKIHTKHQLSGKHFAKIHVVLFSAVNAVTLIINTVSVGVNGVFVHGGPNKKKRDHFFRVNNFARVSGRKACDMSKDSEFCLEKSFQIICH